tara:strand:+ start:2213 stop:3223 length:1011 start_codon:yes stop_codon:yes gene_type:complete
MKLLKLLFSIAVSCGIILAAYYMVWNFMANKRLVTITETLKTSENFKFNFKGTKLDGYPNNIKITIDDLSVKSKDGSFKYGIGDVLFTIYPFVLEEQAEISLPTSHSIIFNVAGEDKEFKLKTSAIDLRFLENTVSFDLTDVMLFDIDSNELILQADKLYYTGFTDNYKHFKFNAKNLQVGEKQIDSLLLDMTLDKFTVLDLATSIITLLVSSDDNYNAEFNAIIKKLNEENDQISVNNMKLVDGDVWFDLSTKFTVDQRYRLNGSVDIVSNDIKTSESILHFLTANNKIDISKLELVKRLQAKNQNKLIRISGKMERGFLQVFNEKVARVKSVKK